VNWFVNGNAVPDGVPEKAHVPHSCVGVHLHPAKKNKATQTALGSDSDLVLRAFI